MADTTHALGGNAMGGALELALARHVLAFEAPGAELRTARRLRVRLPTRERAARARVVSVSMQDGELYQFLRFLVASQGASLANERAALAAWVATFANVRWPKDVRVATTWTSEARRGFDVSLVGPSGSHFEASDGTPKPAVALVALFAWRPNPLLPLSLASARRAVKFVHGVVALVTANAYISTLGGGHFLCLHLKQAKVMARLQIAISDALQDPVLRSKCRVNLAYNAMREGRFRRAQRIIQEEFVVSKELDNEELDGICHAAQVYLVKTYRLHKEFERMRRELVTKEKAERSLIDNFYRQRVVRKAK